MAHHDFEDKAVHRPPEDKARDRWDCAGCGAENAARRRSCRRCGQARSPRPPEEG